MTARRLAAVLFVAAPLVFVVAISAQQPQARLAGPIADSARATLTGSQPPRTHIARDLGAVDGSTALPSMTIFFSRSAQQQSDLDALVAAQQNPSSPQYHQWLTAAQFGARFGVADSDIAQTEAWLQSQGFSVLSVSPSRNSITFSGTAAIAARAFGAEIHRYTLNGENHIAPSADLTLPASLAGIVSDVRGLSDFRPHPHFRKGNGAAFKPSFTSAQTGNHYLTPGDISVIYDIKPAYSAGYNGAGETIAILGQSFVSTTDITNFQTAIGQTAKAPNLILVPNSGNGGAQDLNGGDESESDLDLEYAGGIAPGATIDFVYVGTNATADVFTALTWAIQNRIAPIINISYGECEPLLGQSTYNSETSILQQAAAQGQTVVSAAGDDGSNDCYIGSGEGVSVATEEELAVDFPSSSQYVTGLGGTEFPSADVTASTSTTTYWQGTSGSDTVVSALSYIPEQVWNDDTQESGADAEQYGLSAGGGGVSIYSPAPSWQAGVPGIPSGASFRFVPDVALDASPYNAPYAYCTSDESSWASGQDSSCNSGLRDSVSQDLTVAGGTSFAAPIFSGMLAVIAQAKGYTWQGLVNPTLYTLASNPATYALAFHDIVNGGNNCTLGATYCGTGPGSTDYIATTGYDEATGLGSVDLNNLLTAWPKNTTTSTAAAFTLSGTAVSINQAAGATATSSGTSTITITPQNGYTGTIAWTVTASTSITTTYEPVCYTLPNTTVSGSSPVTATLTLTTVASGSCPSGTTALVRKGGTQTAAVHRPVPPSHRSPAVPVLAGFGIISVGLIALLPGDRRKRLPGLLAVIVLAGVSFGVSGCGGASTGTTCITDCTTTGPTVTDYTITVIGTDTTSSSTTANTSFAFTLTIQ